MTIGGPIFQSTLPAGGATDHFFHHTRRKQNFNPRSPRGERQQGYTYYKGQRQFQSTLPAGGATMKHSFHIT